MASGTLYLVFGTKFNHKTIAISIAIVLVLWVGYIIFYPMRFDSEIKVTIPEGSSVKNVSKILSDNNLIRNRYVFIFYVSALGVDKNIQAGDYIISDSSSISDMVYMLSKGLSERQEVTITIQEGLNVWEIDKKLNDLGLIVEGEFSSKFFDQEGYLFPDTYRLRQQENGKIDINELKRKMTENFKLKTAELFKDLPQEEIDNVIITASMLEKEAKTEKDMKLVSGIIAKRLSLNMLLEIDASVVYGACLRTHNSQLTTYNMVENCDVTFQSPAAEIKINSLYNTYIHKGLPAGPISNPGLVAIRSAFNSQSSDYLYYLSTRDGSEIIYSKTSTEHARNRKKYLGI